MQINNKVILGENVSTTQSGVNWKGGKGMFTANGTFGGGTVKLQMLIPAGEALDETNWVDIFNQAGTKASLTVAGAIPFEAPAGQLRVNIATATAVYSYAIGMHQ